MKCTLQLASQWLFFVVLMDYPDTEQSQPVLCPILLLLGIISSQKNIGEPKYLLEAGLNVPIRLVKSNDGVLRYGELDIIHCLYWSPYL
jgi:hypothetical protein